MMIVITTNDGSSTVQLEDSGLTYHSKHGAIQESRHVFIQSGLRHYQQQHTAKNIRIFEMGFGTGLNCLLTYAESREFDFNIEYSSIDLHPIHEVAYTKLNFCDAERLSNYKEVFQLLHTSNWNQQTIISPSFILKKIIGDIRTFIPSDEYDIIYFDAFSYEANPDQWTEQVFKTLYNSLSKNGVLVTYSSKVIVRRALEAAGFAVQKIKGPTGKREIVRAIK